MSVPAVNPSPTALPTGLGRVLVLGGGYTGRRFAEHLAERGVDTLLTRRRRPEAPAGSGSPGVEGGTWIGFDPAEGFLPDEEDLAGTTHVLVTIPPGEGGEDPVLRHLGRRLAALPLQWIGYLSTTGVYGDRGGAWVDETTPTAASPGRSEARLACEEAWRNSGLPVQVFRLPSIYGPGRTPFESLRNGTARLIHKPGQVFSRIHVDDIVGALVHCLAIPSRERPGTVIVADEAPCPSSETLGFAAHLLGCKLPAVQRFERIAPTMSAMALSFWNENRRASSLLLREELGYALRYPTYREGLGGCFRELLSVNVRTGSGSSRNGTLRS